MRMLIFVRFTNDQFALWPVMQNGLFFVGNLHEQYPTSYDDKTIGPALKFALTGISNVAAVEVRPEPDYDAELVTQGAYHAEF